MVIKSNPYVLLRNHVSLRSLDEETVPPRPPVLVCDDEVDELDPDALRLVA